MAALIPAPQLFDCVAAMMAPTSWPQKQLPALSSRHMDCHQTRWQGSMARHSRGVASQHHCSGWATRVQAKQDTQPAGHRSVDCVSTGMDTKCGVSQDDDAGKKI